jgi:hypothetical protein
MVLTKPEVEKKTETGTTTECEAKRSRLQGGERDFRVLR